MGSGGGPPRVLIPPRELAAGVARVAGEISATSDDGVVLIGLLKGSVPFLADLIRLLTVNPVVDFMALSSYAPDTGRVRIVKDIELDIHDRDVIVVEDIVDTGLTLTWLRRELAGRRPRSIRACALLDKAVRRIVPTPLEYRGFEIGDEFVIGYGLDFDQRYRDLDRVLAADLRVLRADPDAYVPELYPRQR
ncbi:MAG: hypoxanthine phosphoribosyltransferase [Actinomycetota bacterium]|nr:hypoxanthine phosphoribosyltransferase [Actinomycetota bacterium]